MICPTGTAGETGERTGGHPCTVSSKQVRAGYRQQTGTECRSKTRARMAEARTVIQRADRKGKVLVTTAVRRIQTVHTEVETVKRTKVRKNKRRFRDPMDAIIMSQLRSYSSTHLRFHWQCIARSRRTCLGDTKAQASDRQRTSDGSVQTQTR